MTTRDKASKAALAIASKGISVFPCKPLDKSPYTPNGFYDATTNPGKVAAYWKKHPDALIGVPAGERSGRWILDVDDLAALDNLPESVRDSLPETLTVRTRSGGLHYYFEHDAGVTNSPGGLPAGIDVRGAGGYYIVPPSPGYSIELRAPVAKAPRELLELILKRAKPAKITPNGRNNVRVDVADSGPIPPGRRNQSLTSIGGSLRSYGFGREEIEAALLEINTKRCTPALPEDEVRRIAASVSRYAAGSASPPPCSDTLALIDAIEADVLAAAWPKVGGKSERSLTVTLLKLARRRSKLSGDGGVTVRVAHRPLALACATSRKSVRAAIARSPHLVQGDPGLDNTQKGGTITIYPLDKGRAKVTHKTIGVSIESKSRECGLPLRAPLTAPRLRWSAPGILRLGKTSEAAIDYLEALEGRAYIPYLAECMHVSRLRDFKRRVIGRLEERGIVRVSDCGDYVELVEDWLEALNIERERSGEIDKLRLDTAKFNRQREAYRRRHEHPESEHDSYGLGAYDPYDPPADPPLSDLAQSIKDYLELSIEARSKPVQWIVKMLMWRGHIDYAPTPEQVENALWELSSERAIRCRLAVARYEAHLLAEGVE